MQIIRRTVIALAATLIAFVASSGAALAAPKPIEPEPPAAPTGGGGFSIGGDSWLHVTLAVLVVAVVLAIAVIGVSRLRHRSPSHA